MRSRTLALAWGAALVFGACGGGRPPPMAPPGLDDLDDAPLVSIAGIELPRLPIDVEPDDPELEVGWARAEAALTMPTPRPPAGEAWEVETWADEALADWMTRRAQALGEAQRALEEARGGRPEYSVVASMLLGLAYSRFALDLRGVATPEAFADRADRANAFRAAMETAAEPLWQRALDAFGSCASVAGHQPAHSLDQWRERCDAEIRDVSAMLPDAAEDDEPDEDRPRRPRRDD